MRSQDTEVEEDHNAVAKVLVNMGSQGIVPHDQVQEEV
jgi:hypothetical protein